MTVPHNPTLRVVTELAVFEVYAEERAVVTKFEGGCEAWADRDLRDAQNVREALSQGYAGEPEAVVWRSLVEHELLHSVVAETLWRTRSRVLSTEAGVGCVPSWLRYEEEAIVIAFQAYTNGIENGTLRAGPLAALSIGRTASVWETRYVPQLQGLWNSPTVEGAMS